MVKHLNRYTPIGGVGNDSTGVDEIRVYDDSSLRPIQRGHLNAILHGVGPEHGSPQVVDGDALWTVQICLNSVCFLVNSLLHRGNSQMTESESEYAGVTWCNDWNGLSPLYVGLADGGRCDFCPVDHFLYAVIGHADDYLILWRGQ